MSPNGKMFAVLGDHEDGLVVDPSCGKVSALVYFIFVINLQAIGIWFLLTLSFIYISLDYRLFEGPPGLLFCVRLAP